MQQLTVLSEMQYFPCISLFKMVATSPIQTWLIEACEYYQKMSFRNRCIVAGSNGLIQLSVPLLQGRNQKTPIRNIAINYTDNWIQLHKRTFISCYKNTPYFEYFAEELFSILDKRHKYLIDLNMELIVKLAMLFKIKSSIVLTNDYQKKYDSNFVDIRNFYLPKNYQNIQPTDIYQQPFINRIGFKSNLSILDYLFCEGNLL